MSGAKVRGINSANSGNTITPHKTTNMGINMITVSLSANLSGTLATAHEISKHIP
jgi:hypothetical protein